MWLCVMCFNFCLSLRLLMKLRWQPCSRLPSLVVWTPSKCTRLKKNILRNLLLRKLTNWFMISYCYLFCYSYSPFLLFPLPEAHMSAWAFCVLKWIFYTWYGHSWDSGLTLSKNFSYGRELQTALNRIMKKPEPVTGPWVYTEAVYLFMDYLIQEPR